MTCTVTVEEMRTREIEVEAEDWDEAFEKVERDYKDGLIDMACLAVRRRCSLGSDWHDFFDIYG